MFNSVKINNLPNSAGVYLFRNSKKRIIYIGKAKNLKKRIKSYFPPPNSSPSNEGEDKGEGGSLKFNSLLKNIKKIDWVKTKSEIEALLLEAKLIKKYQPIFNVKFRDDKNYFYVAITEERFPRVFLTHQIIANAQNQKSKIKNQKLGNYYIGPFTDGSALKSTLYFLRKIFPYCACKKPHNGYCLNYHIKRCLGFCCNKNLSRRITKKQINKYKRNINELKLILTGRRNTILKRLKSQMKMESNKRNFEKAAELRDKVFSLEKVFEHSLPRRHSESFVFTRGRLREESHKFMRFFDPTQRIGSQNDASRLRYENIKRIEAYDISNIQGTSATGSMITLKYSLKDKKFRADKNLYRRFKIKTIKGANDTAMIKEVLSRRLKHKEWLLPDLILIDGGRAQLNAALKIMAKQQITNNKQRKTNDKRLSTDYRVIALAKRNETIYTKDYAKPIAIGALPQPLKNGILAARDEAHRFAVKYHRKLREKNFFNPNK